MNVSDGIIVKGIGGFYYVKTDSQDEYECKARGIFRKDKIIPTIGDMVQIEINGGKGSVLKIYPRKNRLARPSVANIDALMLVIAAASPAPDLFLTDKMLVNAAINGISAAVCINKTDISEAEEIREIYEKAGFEVFSASAETGRGIDDIKAFIRNRITAFAGLSGVGKSSLLKLITQNEIETGAVSEKIQRGRHTTRHVELFPLKEGGYVLDTPGFSSMEVDTIRPLELASYFPEMPEGQCRFRGCAHINEPDCAVKEKLFKGEISFSRYESYTQLYEALKNIKEWEK